jgi:hypothetical protein
VTALYAALDPVRLLSDMRTAQQQLVDIADRPIVSTSVSTDGPAIEEFLAGLRIAWKDGEVRPTARPKPKQKRGSRRNLGELAVSCLLDCRSNIRGPIPMAFCEPSNVG